MWEIIRNILNPKVKRPESCVCLEEDFRKYSALYSDKCPNHQHHIEDNELRSKCKEV